MLCNDSVNPVTAIQSWQAKPHGLSNISEPNLHSQVAYLRRVTTIWGNGFLMRHFKVQGTQVTENEVLYLQLCEELVQDRGNYLQYLKWFQTFSICCLLFFAA